MFKIMNVQKRTICGISTWTSVHLSNENVFAANLYLLFYFSTFFIEQFYKRNTVTIKKK